MTAKLHPVARALLFGATEPKAWTRAAFATPSEHLYGFAHGRETSYQAITRSWQSLGLPGRLTSVDGADAPFGGSHRLTTDTDACRGDPGDRGLHHNCPVVDDYTPLASDGTPALQYVWDYLLATDRLDPTPPVATSTTVAPTRTSTSSPTHTATCTPTQEPNRTATSTGSRWQVYLPYSLMPPY